MESPRYDQVESIIREAEARNQSYLVGEDINDLLKALNIPVPLNAKASSVEGAQEAAERIGFPVVLKVASQRILHKSEVGGVRTGIRNGDDLKLAYSRMMTAVKQADNSQEVTVQEEVNGIEVIIGGRRDKTFGPIVMFGLGGVWVELLQDVSIRLCPVSESGAIDMLKEIRGFPLLNGYRGSPRVNVDSIVRIIRAVSSVMERFPNISEFEINPFIISHEKSSAVDARLVLGEAQSKMTDSGKGGTLSGDSFNHIFNARSIAVVGGSLDYSKVGGRIVSRILNHGYQGKLAVINPKERSAGSLESFPSISQVPFEIDAALLVVSSESSVRVMEECSEKKVKFAAVYSTGFKEIDDVGVERENRLLEAARNGGVRFVGPNILGLIRPKSKLFAEFTSYEGEISLGAVGFAAQSGGLGSSLVTEGVDRGLGVSALISTGNEADLDMTDAIDYFSKDSETKVIVCYLENVSNGFKLKMAAEEALNVRKPLIVYKAGISQLGKNLAKSHTGAVAVDDKIFDCFTKEYGVIRTSDLYETLDFAKAFSMQPLPKGNRVGIVSGSGGANVILTDILSADDVTIPEFSPDVQKKLASFFPDTVIRNPVDVSATVVGKPELIGQAIDTILSTENIDIMIVVVTTFSEKQGRVISEGICENMKHGKTILVVWPFPRSSISQHVKYLQEHSIPVYLSVGSAAKSAAAMIRYEKFLERIPT